MKMIALTVIPVLAYAAGAPVSHEGAQLMSGHDSAFNHVVSAPNWLSPDPTVSLPLYRSDKGA